MLLGLLIGNHLVLNLILFLPTAKENLNGSVPVVASLARVERTDFLQPMLIGEVAQVHAELTYASNHSIEVTAYVWAENLKDGSKRLTNQ